MWGSTSKAARLGILALILASCVGCDRVTKQIAIEQLKDTPARTYWGNLLRIEYAENKGGFLSLGAQLSEQSRFVLLTLVNTGFMVVISWLLLSRWNMDTLQFLSWALILAGGIGNLIDRMMYGGLVIDFMNIGLGGLRTGIFNVADIAITAGVIGLLLATLFAPQEEEPQQPAPAK